MADSIWFRLRRVRPADLIHVFKFISAWPFAQIYKRFRGHLWLLCEYGTEARDNAYYLFAYLRQEQPQVDAAYAISKNGRDFPKVRSLGETVEYGSWRHWLYYIAAEVNISSQKGGKPNAAVCYALEVSGLWKNTRAFLQHGVIKDDLPFLHYKYTKMRLFSCAAKPEFEFVRNTFGYPDGYVQYLGLCRFDALHAAKADLSLILIAPTWRHYLYFDCDSHETSGCDFLESDYYKAWSSLLSSPDFLNLIHSSGKRVIFCPHRNMQRYAKFFSSPDPSVSVLCWENEDITELIHRAGMLITDYSSIFMDFAYMKRPVLYYQFDYEKFRSGHMPLGYFDYKKDAFGPICGTLEVLIRELKRALERDCQMEPAHLERQRRFFEIYDNQNCERTYLAINEICNEKHRKTKQSH